jgi:ABC-type phosphonate transport system ATPase subunit
MSLPRPVEVATGPEPFLVMRDLVKRYPGVLALDRFGGAIGAGVVLGLLGKNGAGRGWRSARRRSGSRRSPASARPRGP